MASVGVELDFKLAFRTVFGVLNPTTPPTNPTRIFDTNIIMYGANHFQVAIRRMVHNPELKIGIHFGSFKSGFAHPDVAVQAVVHVLQTYVEFAFSPISTMRNCLLAERNADCSSPDIVNKEPNPCAPIKRAVWPCLMSAGTPPVGDLMRYWE